MDLARGRRICEMNNKVLPTPKDNALLLARRLRELAEDIEYEVARIRDDAHTWEPDMHRAQANRDALSLWRLSARLRRVLYGKEAL